MKAVFLLFDSLNRHALSCYADDAPPTPNFDRLARRGVVFDRHFVGSLPCMPARRDIQTGRLNFLHRGWGPLEPFDHSLAAILRDAGVTTHLITDHYHYFEDGGAGFHGRYSSWEFIRGQEKDKWRAAIAPDTAGFAARFDEHQHDFSPDINSKLPYYVNREYLERTGVFPLTQCFGAATDFLDRNARHDHWLLHLECFDPHEPFFAPERFLADFPDALAGKIFDWPSYGRADIPPALLRTLRANYHALVRACDHSVGELLDCFRAEFERVQERRGQHAAACHQVTHNIGHRPYRRVIHICDVPEGEQPRRAGHPRFGRVIDQAVGGCLRRPAAAVS